MHRNDRNRNNYGRGSGDERDMRNRDAQQNRSYGYDEGYNHDYGYGREMSGGSYRDFKENYGRGDWDEDVAYRQGSRNRRGYGENRGYGTSSSGGSMGGYGTEYGRASMINQGDQSDQDDWYGGGNYDQQSSGIGMRRGNRGGPQGTQRGPWGGDGMRQRGNFQSRLGRDWEQDDQNEWYGGGSWRQNSRSQPFQSGQQGYGDQDWEGGQRFEQRGQEYGNQGYSQGSSQQSYGQGYGYQGYSQGQSMRGRGPKGYQRSDERIREEICECLSDNPWLDASDIEIQVQNGEVTLSGTVDSRRSKRIAEDALEGLSGVQDIQNNLRVRRSGEQQGMSDSPAQSQSRQGTASGGQKERTAG